jgi:hypothetical protein
MNESMIQFTNEFRVSSYQFQVITWIPDEVPSAEGQAGNNKVMSDEL